MMPRNATERACDLRRMLETSSFARRIGTMMQHRGDGSVYIRVYNLDGKVYFDDAHNPIKICEEPKDYFEFCDELRGGRHPTFICDGEFSYRLKSSFKPERVV
jgi:hypothetical protein